MRMEHIKIKGARPEPESCMFRKLQRLMKPDEIRNYMVGTLPRRHLRCFIIGEWRFLPTAPPASILWNLPD